MSNIYDQAILDWANAELRLQDIEEEAVSLDFDGWLGCYSSWTCDYGVTATIRTASGQSVTTEATWTSVLEALPAYVEAYERLAEDHWRSHQHGDEE